MSSSEASIVGPRRREPVVIKPQIGWAALDLTEVWRYRELLFFLAWRDIRLRYKETYLGAAWAVLQPILTMAVFTIFFGRLAGIKAGTSVPYPIWCYCGLLPWTFFSHALTQSSASLVTNRNLLKKVYFPRLFLPASSVLAGLVDLAIAMTLLFAMMLFYKVYPTANIVFLPLLVLLATMLAVGVGLWLSAINLEYRDVQYTLPFLTQFWMFLSPVAYPSTMVPVTAVIAGTTVPVRALYGLNPMAGVIEGFRWCLLGQGQPPGALFWVSVLMTFGVFVSGLFYFKRVEKSFADVA